MGKKKVTNSGLSIRLEALTKIFYDKKSGKETRAVDNFNVLIPEGKLIGLLGPSGCKSTKHDCWFIRTDKWEDIFWR